MMSWWWRRFPGFMAGLALLASGLRYEPDRSGDQPVVSGPPPTPTAGTAEDDDADAV